MLSVVLLLFVGIVVGELAALQRSRAEVAQRREREAWALFRVSRALATRDSTKAVLPDIAAILVSETQMTRAWFSLGPDDARERVAADTGSNPPPAPRVGTWFSVACRATSRRSGSGSSSQHPHAPGRRPRARRIESELWPGAVPLGRSGPYGTGEPANLTGRRPGSWPPSPTRSARRLPTIASRRKPRRPRSLDRATRLKSALLQSVSHDFRTPLATIRAAAGTLRPGLGLSAEDQQESADAIDREVEYLNRLGTNLLDLSRIEAGALRADRDVFELDDLVERILERLRPRLGDRRVEVELSAPPVEVDPIFFEEALTNVLENAIKYTAAGIAIRIGARDLGDGFVRLSVEDAGPACLPRPSLGCSRSSIGSPEMVMDPDRGRESASRSSAGWWKRWVVGSRLVAANSAASRSTSTCRWPRSPAEPWAADERQYVLPRWPECPRRRG